MSDGFSPDDLYNFLEDDNERSFFFSDETLARMHKSHRNLYSGTPYNIKSILDTALDCLNVIEIYSKKKGKSNDFIGRISNLRNVETLLYTSIVRDINGAKHVGELLKLDDLDDDVLLGLENASREGLELYDLCLKELFDIKIRKNSNMRKLKYFL